MANKLLLTTVVCLSFIFHSKGQNSLARQWDYGFGGTGDDYLNTLNQTPDGGFLLGGRSNSGANGVKTQASKGGYDYWIVKADVTGNKIWDKVYGGTGDDNQRRLVLTSDGGYIIGGRSNSAVGADKSQASRGGFDYWIVKVDSMGNIQWDKTFGGTADDYLLDLRQTNDGGYILGGWTSSGVGGDKTQPVLGSVDYWVVRIDSAGNKLWDQDYGGDKDDFLYTILPTNDNGFLLGGWTNTDVNGNKTQPTKGGYDYWIIKIDSGGNILWDKDFGGSADEGLSTMQYTRDGNYILAGRSYSGANGDKSQPNWDATGNTLDYWILKMDPSGNKIWDKTYGGTGMEDDIGNVFQTKDDGYLIAGTSYSPIGGDKSESNLGTEQTWIVKTDSLGNLQWDKTLRTNSTTNHDETGLAWQTKDGCFVFANFTTGGSAGDKSQASYGGVDYWIIKYCDTTQCAKPVADFTPSGNSICPNTCIDLINTSSGANAYQWYLPGVPPDSSTDMDLLEVCFSTPGNYPVTLIAFNGTCPDTVIKNITVHPVPAAPIITQRGDTLFASQGYILYQWYFEGNIIPGANDSFYVVTQTGTYSVNVIDSNGCNVSMTYLYTGITSRTVLPITIYPNPVKNILTITGVRLINESSLEIYNVLGEKVYHESIQPQTSTVSIDFSSFPKGIFLVKISSGEKIFLGKLVSE